MLKKFTDGLIFGCGFGVSFIALWYIWAYFIFPLFADSYTERLVNNEIPAVLEKYHAEHASATNSSISTQEPSSQFHELELDEQIKVSSVIALAKYKKAPDGTVKAIITELLKKDPDVTFYYDIGDEYRSASYTPRENTLYGDGVVIFFTGSPPRMRMSMSYFGDRIHSLGDLPVELLREKCKENNA